MSIKKILLLFLTTTFLCNLCDAQISFMRMDSIQVIQNNDTLKNAWAGGFNAPQFSSVDMNGDGKNDLFVFDRDNNLIKTFINEGISSKSSYVYAPKFIESFPKNLNGFALLADYNCDGYEDIFTYIPGGIAVYKNNFSDSGSLSFTLITTELLSDYGQGGPKNNIYVAPGNIPAIVDIDNDGDLDILSYGVSSFFVQYHQNQSIELHQTCDSLTFKMVDGCWGKFAENSNSYGITLGVSCKSNGVTDQEEEVSANGGTTLLAADLDADGDKEYIQGQLIYSKNMVMATNGGDALSAVMVSQDKVFPSNTTGVYLSFPAMFHLDVNNDGKKDMIAATNTFNGSPNSASAWYYKNVAQSDSVILDFVTNAFLQEEMIEVGSGANPHFFDHNNDGLLDLVIGNYGYYNPNGLYDSKLALYENSGSPSKPVFKLITTDYASLGGTGLNSLYPTFGDLDNDGDDDMIVGDYEGKLYLYENTAGVGNTSSFSLLQAKYKGIDVGNFSTPQLIDMDRDGLLDLVVGEGHGNLNFFRNTGTVSLADFDTQPDNSFFGGVDVRIPCCTGYSSPFIYEKSVGEYAMYVGSEDGTLYHYETIENNLTGIFSITDSIVLPVNRSSISMGDIDNDGTLEIIYGEYLGGCSILKTSGSQTEISMLNKSENKFTIFPNPTHRVLYIQSKSSTHYNATLYNLVGQQISTTTSNSADLVLNLQHINSGIYQLILEGGEEREIKKVVIRL